MNLFKAFKNRRRILGLNERYLKYIRTYNHKRALNIADDKILSKEVLSLAQIPTPKMIGKITNYHELERFDWNSLPKSFVIKPVHGVEGGGIDIFYNRDTNGNWIRANGSRVHLAELKTQIKDILDGRYSLNQNPDKVLIEERVKVHKAFKYYSYKGAPDIRIIVFNGVPVMSFIRLPTLESNGKANCALGALALGIDMATGTTTVGIQGKSKEIDMIPGTKLLISGLKIPYWSKILNYAIQAQVATKLNFAAVDFLIDREQGPMVVELNARPGLSIQLANKDGLRWRLKKVRDIKVKTIEKGVRLAKDLFGGEIEEEIEAISGKDVIGIYEKIKLYDQSMQEVEIHAKIDTGADSTSIDKALATSLGYGDVAELEIPQEEILADYDSKRVLEACRQLEAKLKPDYPNLQQFMVVKSSHGVSIRPQIKLTMKLKDTQFETLATIFDRSNLDYPVIVGRKSLGKFLVDPSKH